MFFLGEDGDDRLFPDKFRGQKNKRKVLFMLFKIELNTIICILLYFIVSLFNIGCLWLHKF